MCDIKPGDEVVCVDARQHRLDLRWTASLIEGRVYTVQRVSPVPAGHPLAGLAALLVCGVPNMDALLCVDIGWRSSRFRKVQKRKDSLTIESFLTIRPGFEEPRKAPVKSPEKREKV